MAGSTGDQQQASVASEFGWKKLYCAPIGQSKDRWRPGKTDEDIVCVTIGRLGVISAPTSGRHNSHDLKVTCGIDAIQPGLYEVKRLHQRPSGSFDIRFKTGRRGETIYGRRDSDIKWFVRMLEELLDTVGGGVEFVTQSHEFIDQALQRRHGKKFNKRLLKLAAAASTIPQMVEVSKVVLDGGVRPHDIQAGFAGLSGIFIIAGHNYTLVKPEEYTTMIGFDSASAEGPKLSFQGVIPL